MILCGMVIIFCLIYIFSEINFLWKLDKAYPRDFMQRGRVRVLLKKEDGTLVNPAISSSKDGFYFLKVYVSFIFNFFVCLHNEKPGFVLLFCFLDRWFFWVLV